MCNVFFFHVSINLSTYFFPFFRFLFFLLLSYTPSFSYSSILPFLPSFFPYPFSTSPHTFLPLPFTTPSPIHPSFYPLIFHPPSFHPPSFTHFIHPSFHPLTFLPFNIYITITLFLNPYPFLPSPLIPALNTPLICLSYLPPSLTCLPSAFLHSPGGNSPFYS